MQLKHVVFAAIGLAVVSTGSIVGYQSGYRWGVHEGQIEGLQAGRNRFDQEWSGSKGDPYFAIQIKDAKARWNAKNGVPPDRVDEGRVPIVMAFPDQNCIQLKLASGSVGGEPIYCYKGNSAELTKEYSDVE